MSGPLTGVRTAPRRAWPILVLAVLVGVIGFLAWPSRQSLTPEQRVREAGLALSRVRASATVVDQSLAATLAVADFGIEKGVKQVPVRIINRLQVELRVEGPDAVALVEPPRVCLVWHFSAPDDAGLTDRCWGEPDLSALLAAQLGRDAAEHPLLPAGRPIRVAADLRRGDVRCDYPPGRWQLELTFRPFVDGASPAPVDLTPVEFAVPSVDAGPLQLLVTGTRFCGLATTVYLDQGEPPLQSP